MRASLPGILLATLAAGTAWADAGTPITGLTLDWSTFRQLAKGSDNWPTTWGGDGNVYTAWGDGPGFGATRVSLGFARLMGNSAASVHGFNLPGGAPAGKSYGLLALGSTLYAWRIPGRLSIQDGTGPNGIVLMRAPRDDLMDRGSWQFFAGLGQGSGPLWSADPGGLRPRPNSAAGVGREAS